MSVIRDAVDGAHKGVDRRRPHHRALVLLVVVIDPEVGKHSLRADRGATEHGAVVQALIGSHRGERSGAPGCAQGAPVGSWLERMLARKPRMLVAVALASKMRVSFGPC